MTDIDNAITNALWHYRRLTPGMPFDEIPQRFNALWHALDILATEHEKAHSDSETVPAHVHDDPAIAALIERIERLAQN